MPSSEVLHKFKHGQLRSGSKTGPLVKNRKQAIAIMLSEKRTEAAHGGKYPEKRQAGGGVNWQQMTVPIPTGQIASSTPIPIRANRSELSPAPSRQAGGSLGILSNLPMPSQDNQAGLGYGAQSAAIPATPATPAVPAAPAAPAAPAPQLASNPLMAAPGSVTPGATTPMAAAPAATTMGPSGVAPGQAPSSLGLAHPPQNNPQPPPWSQPMSPWMQTPPWLQQPWMQTPPWAQQPSVGVAGPDVMRQSGGNVGGFNVAKGLSAPSAMLRTEDRKLMHGPIVSSVPGRTDAHKGAVASGSYVIPADIVSGRGQGNTLAGMDKLSRLFKMGPYGSSAAGMKPGHTMPKGMPFAKPWRGHFAAGGVPTGGHHVPVNLSGGEFVVPPENLQMVVHPHIGTAHDIMDKWVVNERERNQKISSKLPGPVQD